jgi:predicted P-loop ATPase
VRYRNSEPWWPDAEFEAEHMTPEQERRFEDDAWQEPIAEFLAGRTRATVFEIAYEALKFERQRIGTADQRRITAILEHLAWRRGKREPGTGKRWWERV